MWDTLTHRWLRIPYGLHVKTHYAKNSPVTVLFIHGIGSSGETWQDVAKLLPNNYSFITIDLLGFGKSPKPKWAVYSAKMQARSIVGTLLKLRPRGRLVIVGHSLGALIAVELTKRYPLLVRSLILCSPPFFSDREAKRLFPKSDDLLKQLFRLIQKHPEEFVKISALAVKLRLANKAYSVTDSDIHSYMGALEASIINQTSLDDAKKLKKSMTILYGNLDPIVVKRNLKELVAANPQAKLVTVLAGHDVRGRFIPAVAQTIKEEVNGPTKR